ncbi:hypothetical protein [Nocardia sp. CA-290969]|uniref:hypothetical protein n=1 Tax=Nocardia sp. CA-290969 TaxID=3239986 RepID=UPI003D90DD68
MSEYPQLNEDELAGIRERLIEQQGEVAGVPDRLNFVFDLLRGSSPAAYLMLTGQRDDVQEKLKQLMGKVEELVEGMFAPWLFIDYAAKWLEVGTKVSAANARVNDIAFNMDGNWDGSAYKAFTASKNAQSLAMTTVAGQCTKIHDELLVIAEEGRILYSNAIQNIGTMLAELGVGLGEAAATAGTALIWSMNNINAAVVAAVDFVVAALTDFIEVQSKVVIASNKLNNMVNDATGLSATKTPPVWPTSQTQEFDNKDDDWKQDGV